jgi:hypothetical protein
MNLFDDETLFPLLVALLLTVAIMVAGGYLLCWLKHRKDRKAAREVIELEQLWRLGERNGIAR